MDPTNASIATKPSHRTATYQKDSTSKPPAELVSVATIDGGACGGVIVSGGGDAAGAGFACGATAAARAEIVNENEPCTGCPSSEVDRQRTVYLPGCSA